MKQSTPRTAIVVGAGIIGLSSACALQARGVRVTLLEKGSVGSGSSWGNAGYITPDMMGPLGDPSVFASSFRALFDPTFPVYIPLFPSVKLVRFLLHFARNSTSARAGRATRVFDQVRAESLAAYDGMIELGLNASAVVEADPLVVAFKSVRRRDDYARGLEKMAHSGRSIKFETLSGVETRNLEPILSSTIKAGVRLEGQRVANPPKLLAALEELFVRNGGVIVESADVVALVPAEGSVSVRTREGDTWSADHVVLATGAWASELAGTIGVTAPLYAGRGYSFTVQSKSRVSHPIYLPEQRLACVPLEGKLRVTGMMEFLAVDTPAIAAHLNVVVKAAKQVLDNVAWDEKEHDWVGSRPCTADGLPLIGPSKVPNAHIATGHGMWGMVLGPLTGELIADSIMGEPLTTMRESFNPLR